MSMNNGTKGVHICRVARIGARPQGERLSAAERNQRLRAIAERLKGSGQSLADATPKQPQQE